MNYAVRDILRSIICKHSGSVVSDAGRCEAFLRDLCGTNRREISVLVNAVREGIPAGLARHPPGVPLSVTVARLSRTLEDHHAITTEAAQWAVEAWAYALGLIDGDVRPVAAPAIGARRGPIVVGRPFTPRQRELAVRDRLAAEAGGPVDAARDGRGAWVDGSAKAYDTLSEALRAAAPGGRVLVGPGTYRESLLLDKEVHVASTGGGPAGVIEGDVYVNAAQASVRLTGLHFRAGRQLTRAGAKPESVLEHVAGDLIADGCVFEGDAGDTQFRTVVVRTRDARARFDGCRFLRGWRSALDASAWAHVECVNCEFEDAYYGVHAAGHAATFLRGCRVRQCTHGVVLDSDGAAVVAECDVAGSAGVGVSVFDGKPFVKDCSIHKAAGSGVRVTGSASPTFDECEISSNGKSGVDVDRCGNATLNRCGIRWNRRFAVAIASTAQARVTGCTVDGNGAGAWSIASGATVHRHDNAE